jgi:lipoprotein-releasing system ATP-binding protein
MLKAQGITKSYGSLKVLKGIDLEVVQGEVVSIVGASGAGKSTLLHILGTLDNPDGGSLHLRETNLFTLKGNSLSKFRNKHIGFIFQFHNLLPEFTSLENVCIPGFISGREEKEVTEESEKLLNLLGLRDRMNNKPSELSGGELQRVAVARALLNRPEIVLADEPSGNLDSKNARELHELFFRLRNELGQTFIIVTHNSELAAMADRTLEIKDGVILV